MAVTSRDKEYMRRLAASLAATENDVVAAVPPPDSDDDGDAPELEFYRRATRLGMVRRGR